MPEGMKSVAPSPAHLALREALHRAIGAEGGAMDVADILAVFSHMVGQLIAMQDQRKVTPAMALQVVQENMQQGNREMVESLLLAPGGTA
jgi:hypothetical protein